MVTTIIGFSMCFMTISLPSFADAQWSVGISGGSEGINGFSLSIGEYYRVPEREVLVIHERGIYEEELPVVFYIAQRARVYPEEVVDLRLSGMSWMDITLYFGLSPEIYYVPMVIQRYGPPYGHAYGYYHNHPRGGWTRNDLHDADIVNQVNLKFISEHQRYAPEKIMRYRSKGRSFIAIDRDISKEKHGKTQYRNQYTKNTTRQNQTIQNVPRLNMTRQNQYTQNVPRQNMTRQNQYTQNAPRQKTTKLNHTVPRPNMTKQSQTIQNVPRPNTTRQNQTIQNVPKPNMTRQNQYTKNASGLNENKQNQHIRNGNKQHEYVQIENDK
jgi:hypothetical protein